MTLSDTAHYNFMANKDCQYLFNGVKLHIPHADRGVIVVETRERFPHWHSAMSVMSAGVRED